MPKQHAASYMQRQNITTRFLYIFVASIASVFLLKKKKKLTIIDVLIDDNCLKNVTIAKPDTR